MNNRYIHIYLYRPIQYLLILFIIVCTMVACSQSDDPTPTPEGKETEFSLTLNTGNYITRAGNTNETGFNNLHAIVLEKESGTYRYQYLTIPTLEEESNHYNIRLYTTENALKLVLIANIDDTATLIEQAMTEEEIKEALLLPFDGEEAAYLPMYGELIFKNGINDEETYDQSVTMIRSVAAVDISLKNELAVAGTFLLKTIQAYRANDLIQIIPNAVDQTEWKVNTPSVPSTAANRITTPFVDAGGATEASPVRIYLPESEEKTNITSQATCLIVGGVYRGQDINNTTVTYYRIDFKDEQDNPTGQLLRNHRYKIIISAVTGPGTTHPDNAEEKDMTTTITGWGDSDHDIEL